MAAAPIVQNMAPPSYPMASLYVGDLDFEVTEAILFEKFSVAGPVLSIRVCRDAITRRSLGYAYVNFQQPADAERAMDTMNFDTVMGRAMRIMWSQRDPTLRRTGVGNIFIKNLDKSIDNKAIYDTFSTFGNILSCKVAQDDEGASKGYGFVHFETEEAAQKAIDKVNGMLLNGKKVFVGRFIPRREREFGEGGRKFTNVFVKNFGEELDEDKLLALFEPFGKINSYVVMKDENQKSRGFGFVSFERPEDAEKACAEINESELESGKKLYACRAQKKSERHGELKRKYEMMKVERMQRYQGINLYVKNLDDFFDDEQLRNAFAKFGTITSAKVMVDENGRSRGFGFVCYSLPEEATKAVTEMNGHIIGTKPLYVALAQRKEDRKAQLASQYMQRLATMRMQSANLGQMFHPGGAGYFVPATLPQPGPRSFLPAVGGSLSSPAGAMRTTAPRWNSTGGQPTTPRVQSAYANATTMTGYTQQVYAHCQPMQSTMPGGRTRISTGGSQIGGVRQQNNSGGQSSRPVTGQLVQGRMNGVAGIPMSLQQRPSIGVNGMPGNMSMAPPPPPQQQQQQGQQRFAQSQAFKYNANTRNMPNQIQYQQQMNQQIHGHQQSIMIHGQEPLTSTMLASAMPREQKQMLGERMFPLIQRLNNELAGKITGMLLEMDNSELLMMLENGELLKSKVDEAVAVLQAHKPDAKHGGQ